MIKGLRSAAVAAVLIVSTAAQAADFSAETVARNSLGQTRTSKLYISNGKVRVEPQGAPSYELLDAKAKTGYFVFPAKKTYIVQPQRMAMYNAASFSIAATPCINLMATGGIITCKSLGPDKINGRVTEKWEVTQTGPGPKGPAGPSLSFTSTVWVDRGLNTIVKAQSARGSLQYQNLKLGPQPANLFALPAGFKQEAMPTPPAARK